MAEGIRLVSVRRGVDPRRFAILSFGGAAGVPRHGRRAPARCAARDRAASRRRAVGVGHLASDLRHEVARTHIGDASRLDADELRAAYRDGGGGRSRVAAAAHAGPVHVRRSADMRYGEQIFEVNVSLDDIDFDGAGLVPQMAAAFHARHEALYTYALPDQEAVLVNARVAVVGELPSLPKEAVLPIGPGVEPREHRRIYLGAWRDVPVYAFDDLAPRQSIEGPAVIESATTTVVLRPGDCGTTTAFGWLDIAIG